MEKLFNMNLHYLNRIFIPILLLLIRHPNEVFLSCDCYSLKLFLFLALLKSADLTKTSAKKIRQELEKKLDTDLDDR